MVQPNALPDDVVTRLIKSYQAGQSTYQLAENFGVRRNTVRDILRRNGVPITGAKIQSLTEDEKIEVRARFQAGWTRR